MTNLTVENLERLEGAGLLDERTDTARSLKTRLRELREQRALEKVCAALLAELKKQAEERLEQEMRIPVLRLRAEPEDSSDVALIACRNVRQRELPTIKRDGSPVFLGWGPHHLGFLSKELWGQLEGKLYEHSSSFLESEPEFLRNSIDGWGCDQKRALIVLSGAEIDELGAQLHKRLRGTQLAHTLFEQVVSETNSSALLRVWERSEKDPARRRVVLQRMRDLGIDEQEEPPQSAA